MNFQSQNSFNKEFARLDFSEYELRVAAQMGTQTTPATQTVTHRTPATFEPRGYYSPTEFGTFK
jgi:hypothetical protein